jgi:zinc-binding alcohol dehydrogenase family protein
MPEAGTHDLLVRVHAVAVNPIDTKVRKRALPEGGSPRVLGWDAAGEVVAVGAECSSFQPGDRVFYSGEITRPGCNAEYQIVDERLAGHMPVTLDFAQAAALPLTAVTAWESLFDRLGISEDVATNRGKALLVIGGAGGVGSIAIQLARQVAGITVIATASRPESGAWVEALGAQHVVDHREPLPPQMAALGIAPDYILCCSDTSQYFAAMAEMVRPQGRVCVLVDAAGPLDINLYKGKSAALVWESMFTRALFRTDDMVQQQHILERVARLVDDGALKTTLGRTLSPINAANLREAHARLESGRTIGKIVLNGWQ